LIDGPSAKLSQRGNVRLWWIPVRADGCVITAFFFFLIAVIAVFVNAFHLGHESMGWRVSGFLLAAFVVLSYLRKSNDPEGE